MPTVSLMVCPPGAVTISSDGTGEYAVCAAGQGSVQQVVIAEPFDPSQLSLPELSSAHAAGFVVMGTGLCIVWAAKQVVRAIRASL